MKTKLILCGLFSVACAAAMSLTLSWIACLPRISYVSLASACERSNSLATAVCVFSSAFVLSAIYAVLHELRQRAIGEAQA
ncbi:MAG: hypothetical protein AAF961_14540 [Planctomycetota bacterium]